MQPGNPIGPSAREPNTVMHLLISALTTGPVGPGDGVGSTNASLVMAACRAGDGLLLKPDRPATTMDAAFAAVFGAAPRAPGGAAGADLAVPNVASTFSTHGYNTPAPLRWHYVYALSLRAAFTVSFDDLGPSFNVSEYLAYDFFAPLAGGTRVSPAAPLVLQTGQGVPGAPAGSVPTRYHVLAPMLPSGHVLLGEVGKVAAMSRQRVSDFTATVDGFSMTVSAAAAETVVFAVLAPGAASVSTVACEFAGPGAATLLCDALGGCTCS